VTLPRVHIGSEEILMAKRLNVKTAFEQGVQEYFTKCGHLHAHEKPHQLWLGIVLAQHIPMHRILSEFDVAKKDVVTGTSIRPTRGVVSFDLCIAQKKSIDDRKFWTRTGHGNQDNTKAATLKSLKQLSIIAELKTQTAATNLRGLKIDLLKMCGAVTFMKKQGAVKFPRCYLIVFDPDRTLPVEKAYNAVISQWPKGVHKPRVLIGP